VYGTESRKNFFHSNSIMNLTRNHLQNLVEHEVQQVDESSKAKAVKRLIKNNPEIDAALKKISTYLMDEKTGLMQHRFDPHSWYKKISNWLRGSDYLNNIPTNELGVSADPIGLRLKKHVETKSGEGIKGPLEWEDIAEFLQDVYDKHAKQLFKEQNEMNTLIKQQLKRLIVEMLPPMKDTTETILSDIYDENQEYTPEELEFWELFGPVVDGTVEEIIEVSDIVSREQIPVLVSWMRNTGIEKLGIVADELELGEKPMNENTFRKLVREEAIKLKKETQTPIREHDIKQMITDVLEEEMAEMGMDMGALGPDVGGIEGEPEVGTPERPDNPRMKQIEKDRAMAQRHQEEMTTRREKLRNLGQRMMGVQGIAQV
jgi:hypothetical protein